MKKRFFILTTFAVLFVSETTIAAESVPAHSSVKPVDLSRESVFDFRLNLGGTIDPGSFLLMGSGEYHIDRFFAIGPMFQIGLNNAGRDYFIPTFGARLLAPIFPSKNFETSLYTGVGGFVWELRGVHTQDFAYTTAVNVDYFLMSELSVGLGGVVNVTSSGFERFRTSFFAGVSYRL